MTCRTHRPKTAPCRGYIALMSSLILSALLVVVSVSASQSAFFARAQGLRFEEHRAARHYANSCARIALYALSGNPSRFEVTGLTVHLQESITCEIESASLRGNEVEFTVRARSGRALSVIYALATRTSETTPFVLSSLRELPHEKIQN